MISGDLKVLTPLMMELFMAKTAKAAKADLLLPHG
jgi:hypothetical protein